MSLEGARGGLHLLEELSHLGVLGLGQTEYPGAERAHIVVGRVVDEGIEDGVLGELHEVDGLQLLGRLGLVVVVDVEGQAVVEDVVATEEEGLCLALVPEGAGGIDLLVAELVAEVVLGCQDDGDVGGLVNTGERELLVVEIGQLDILDRDEARHRVVATDDGLLSVEREEGKEEEGKEEGLHDGRG